MSILSGHEILSEITRGVIKISSFTTEQLNPVSYDLRLGEEIAVYYNPSLDEALTDMTLDSKRSGTLPPPVCLDARKENPVKKTIIPDDGFLLQPNQLYLMHTQERIWTNRYVPVLDGKSSIGRLGIFVHATAGYGDPGFDGQYTLEVTAVHPVVIFKGMRFCQIRFHECNIREGELYNQHGHYTGKQARGAVPSMAWKQIEEDEKV